MPRLNNKNTFLSKSQFIRGLQCHKSLYLHRCHPELRDALTSSQEALFQSGTEVGILAQELFPGGITIEYDGVPLEDQIRYSREAIDQGASTLYEAAFSSGDVFIKADILNQGKRGWGLYEVKSSTKVADVYLYDVAVQYHVLSGAGLPVNKAFVVNINNQYTRQGTLELEELFARHDVTKEIKDLQGFVSEEIKKQKKMLQGDVPVIDIGEQCSDPYDCDFMGHCWKHISEESIFSLGGRGLKKFDLYRQGIVKLEDVPDEVLSKNQLQQKTATLEKKDFISGNGVRRFLDSLWFPLCFLDFECFMGPIPPFNGMRPYQHIPYQYSLHILENEAAEPKHYEFLAGSRDDHREELLRKLLKEIPDNGCILAYNAAYEAGRLKDLAEWYPQYRSRIEKLLNNLRDLAEPFRGRAVYYHQMNGSYSIKAVLPALVPNMSYDSLEVSDGQMAMEQFYRMCQSMDAGEKETIRKSLLEYCGQDSLGMVEIYRKLRELSI